MTAKTTNEKKNTADGERKKPEAETEQADGVQKLLKSVERKLRKKEVKPTLGDYIKLVQLQKELGEDQPKEIKVTWVEAEKPKSDSEE